jgi:diguanylate cyclase (GGDEF)-like protein
MGYPAVYLNYRMEQAQSALARMAHTDVLTGVANRRGFFEHAEKIFRESEASDDRPLALMMVDIDHFKRVNDRYGHAAGDELLKRTARMIHDTVKEKTAPAASLVARIGGEEFAVLIAGADRAEAAALANSICATAPFAGFHSDGNFIHATLSVGVAMRSPGESVDAAMRVADKAVYEAKRAGRDRWVLAVADRFVASSYSADIPPSAMAPAHQAA